MKRSWSNIILILILGMNINAQAPELYNRVNHLVWVVEDLRSVKKYWQQLGFDQIEDKGEVTIISKFSGEDEEIPAKMAIGYLDNATVVWIQTSRRGSPFSEYIKTSKEGIYSMVYAMDDKKSLKEEAQRLKEEGILILDNLEIKTDEGKINYYLFNTAKSGKYTLGFMLEDDAGKLFNPEKDGSNLQYLRFARYGFAIADETHASGFWHDLGFPEFTIQHDSIFNKIYHGGPADYDIKQGWQQPGTIPVEWCITVQGPNVIEDHIEMHGEGFHHLAFETPDLDKLIAEYAAKGFAVSQSGSWGEFGKPGSGKFTFLDPKGLGGITIELLWNYK